MTRSFVRFFSSVPVTVLLVSGAIGIGALIAFDKTTATAPSEARYVENWERLAADVADRKKGSNRGAPVQIMVFSDYQCPYCRDADAALRAVQQRFPEQMSITWIHYPLSTHEFAREAALSAEGAREQNRFASYHQLVFNHHDQLSRSTFDTLAIQAEIPNQEEFRACVEQETMAPAIQKDQAIVDRLDVVITPTLVVNGVVRTGAKTESELMAIVEGLTETPPS